MNPTLYWLAVALTTIISAARLTRLATVDKFPPARWLRDKYADATDDTEWQWLVLCGYCFAPWATLFVVVWGWFADVYSTAANQQGADAPATAWWLFNGVMAAAYLAAILMAHDGDDD